MDNGYIKSYRNILNSDIFNNPNPYLLKVWIWVLHKAFYDEKNIFIGKKEVHLKPGQFVFGRKSAAIELNMSESTVYDYMKLLQKRGSIDINSNNKFSVITIVNWGFYQGGNENFQQQRIQQRTQQRTQQRIHNKEYKEKKNIKNKRAFSNSRNYDFDELQKQLEAVSLAQ